MSHMPPADLLRLPHGGSLASAERHAVLIEAYYRRMGQSVRVEINRTPTGFAAMVASPVVCDRQPALVEPAAGDVTQKLPGGRKLIWKPWAGHNAQLLKTILLTPFGAAPATPTQGGPMVLLPPSWGYGARKSVVAEIA